MSEYEGLMLPELFELLHDISVPEAISWFPQTSGWLVLVFWLTTCLCLFSFKRFKAWKANAYRREALVLLEAISIQYANDPEKASLELSSLLKRTALAAFPREQVAKLYGTAWADFLIRTSGNDSSVAEHAPTLACASYRKEPNSQTLFQPAKRWIECHHA